MDKYDSKADTLEHIRRVNDYLLNFCMMLMRRAQKHDDSKLVSPEKDLFDEVTPKLRGLEYGSEEYRANLESVKPALQHHYWVNSHHPEHYENGIDGMSLMDVVEMFCDWRAAAERTENGDINKSIEINSKRFNMSEQLVNIFKNTLKNT